MKNTKFGKILFMITVVIMVALSGGCASHNLKDPARDDVSLVLGYLDMSEAPGDLRWVSLKQLMPVSDKPYWSCAVDKGMFWNSHIPPGSYKFTEFGGTSGLNLGFMYLFDTEVKYSFGAQGRGKMDPVIQRPGIHYVGSYRVKLTKRGFFTPSEYDIEPIESPSEKELLERLLVHAKDEFWRKRILVRLEELK